MKKIILAFVIFFSPLFVFGAVDSVHINPITIPTCGVQSQIILSGVATRSSGQRTLSIRLDDIEKLVQTPVLSTWTKTIYNVSVGNHIARAIIFFDYNENSIRAQDSVTFTVPSCDPIPPVVDMCPNIDGQQDAVPTGFVLDGSNCVPITIPPIEPPATSTDPISSSTDPIITPTATVSVDESHSVGFMSPCEYIRVYDPLTDCVYSEALRMKFAFDEDYRESILAPWRKVIFGE